MSGPLVRPVVRRCLAVVAGMAASLLYIYVVVELVCADEVRQDEQHWGDGL